jgi:hypothetical protein
MFEKSCDVTSLIEFEKNAIADALIRVRQNEKETRHPKREEGQENRRKKHGYSLK